MGLSGLMRDWYPLPHFLAVNGDETQPPARPVILLDNRGIGESNFPPDWDGDLSMEIMAQDVVDVLHHLRIKRVDLLGWSMGGYIVQYVLARALEESRGKNAQTLSIEGINVHKVLLTATMPRAVGTEMDPVKMAEIAASAPDRAEGQKRAARYLLELQYSHSWLASQTNADVLTARLEDALKGQRPQRVITAQLNAILGGEDQSPILEQLPASVPVALIHGDSDRMVDPVGGKLLEKAIPHAQRLLHPEVHLDFGHFWFDFPHTQSWATLISQFLNDAPAARL